jgi:hypothetical protein
MSTFFFKPAAGNTENVSKLKELLEKLKIEDSIENWNWNEGDSEQSLAVETNKLSSEELKHILRETGVDVDFTKAPQIPR